MAWNIIIVTNQNLIIPITGLVRICFSSITVIRKKDYNCLFILQDSYQYDWCNVGPKRCLFSRDSNSWAKDTVTVISHFLFIMINFDCICMLAFIYFFLDYLNIHYFNPWMVINFQQNVLSLSESRVLLEQDEDDKSLICFRSDQEIYKTSI